MTINQLRYFLQVCECGGIANAAAKFYISHQALSKNISKLEQDLGVPLFLRTKSGIVLTEAGTCLLQRCRPIIEQFEEFDELVRRDIRLTSGKLRLGILEDGFNIFTLEGFQRFHECHPQYKISVKEYPFRTCNQLLLDGILDAALTLEPVCDAAIITIPILCRELVLILHKDNPLAGQDMINIQALRDQDFVISINEKSFTVFRQLCSQAGFEPHILQRVSQLSSMHELCNQNGYTGITSDFVAEKLTPRYPNLISAKIAGQKFTYPILLSYRIDNEKKAVLTAFIDFLTADSGLTIS